MSGLLKRLERTLKGRTESFDEPTSSLSHELDSNNALLTRITSGYADFVNFADLKGATECETPYGTSHQIVTVYPLDHRHGNFMLERLYDADCTQFASLAGDARLDTFIPDDALFLDIEATGLDHGAGTFAFMVGLGYRQNDSFIVKQLFLPDMHEELPMLHVLKEHLDRFRFLISFNGKSYDLTVLQSRMIIQRLYSKEECQLKLQPHLDLLHLARNMYRKCFENTRLPTLEESLLEFHRIDDVPSALVPTMWFEFLRTGNASSIKLVADHNLYDVLSMVALAGLTARHSHRNGVPSLRASQVALNLGRVWMRRKHSKEAIAAFEVAEDEMLDDADINDKYAGLGKAYGRLEQYHEQGNALARWCESRPEEADAWTAYAIFQERRAKKFESALDAAQRAHQLASSQTTLRRVARLQRRLEKSR